jgi:hypothetical protein
VNEAKAKTVVIASVGTAAILSSLESVSKGQRPPVSVFIGAAVSGFLLLTLAEVSPSLGAAFGGLLLTGAVLRNGTAATAALSQTFDK